MNAVDFGLTIYATGIIFSFIFFMSINFKHAKKSWSQFIFAGVLFTALSWIGPYIMLKGDPDAEV